MSASKSVVIKCVAGLAVTAMLALCGMYLRDINTAMYYVAVCALTLVFVVYAAVDGNKYKHVERTLTVCTAFAIIAVGAYMLYYLTGLNVKFGDFDAIKQFILDSGFWGGAVFVGLTIFQVIVLPIPAAVTIVLGVAIYGGLTSFFLSTLGTFIGSLAAFALGKVFGRKLCNWMFGEENTEKYAKLLNEKGRFLFIIMLLFPAFPDDMLCMIAGITTMSYPYFIAACLLTRPVMIGVYAFLGSGAIPFEGWGIPVWISLVCLMFVLFVVITMIKKKLEAGKISKPKKHKNKLSSPQ